MKPTPEQLAAALEGPEMVPSHAAAVRETPRARMLADRLEGRVAGAYGEDPQKWAEQHFGRPFQFDEGTEPETKAAMIEAIAQTLELGTEAGAPLPARFVFKPQRLGIRRSLGETSPFGMFLDQPRTWYSQALATVGFPKNRADSAPTMWINQDARGDFKRDPSIAPHLVRHELAHVQHGAIGKAAPLDDADREVAGRVSPYARKDQRELVAEVFANMAAGKKYDDEVMDLYQRAGGPAAGRW